jgi:hypothetical protein
MTAQPPASEPGIRVEIRIVLPSGDRLNKTLVAEPSWRQALDLPLREYVNVILHRAAAEAHRWVSAHVPAEDSQPDLEESR